MKRLLNITSLLLIIIGFASCSSDQEELFRKLYADIPAEAEFVADLDISKILKDTGAKIGKDGVSGADKIIEILASDDAKLKADLQWACSPQSGISPRAAVLFIHAGHRILHFSLDDAEKFRNGVAEREQKDWEKISSGKTTIYILDNTAVTEDMAFIGTGISAEYITRLLNLSEVESFNGVDYSSKMAAKDNAVNYYASIDGLMDISGLGFANKTQAKMMLGMFFNNPKYIVGSMDMDKKEILFETAILDNTLKPSKCELEMSRIDPAQIAALDGNANFIFALAVSQKLIKQINKVASSAGGALPAQFSDLISPIDGTIAFASPLLVTSTAQKSLGKDYRLSVPTNGKQNAALSQFLQTFGNLQIDGNILNISKGSYGDGRLSLAATSKEMEGAWLAVAFSIDNQRYPLFTSGLFTILPSDGSMKLKLKLTLYK